MQKPAVIFLTDFCLEIPLAFLYPKRYNSSVIEIRQTATYFQWFDSLRDRQARARINARIRRLSLGNFGDVKPIGEGVSELRIDFGPGYRVYFVQRGQTLVVLLAGGNKRTQDRDIKKALKLAREL
jgi:putative addiction module killer protein